MTEQVQIVPLGEMAHSVLDRLPAGVTGQVIADRTTHGLTRFANSHIHQHVGETTLSVHLRVLVDGRPASSLTTRTDASGLDRLVADTLEIARVTPVDEEYPALVGADEPMPTVRDPLPVPTPDERAELVSEFIAAAPRSQAAGYCEARFEQATYANTAGRTVDGTSQRCTIEGIHRIGLAAGLGHGTSRDFTELDGTEAGARAAKLMEDCRDATAIEPERLPVILGPEAVATVGMFLAFYGLNAKAVAEQRSFAVVGERQLDPTITLVDDVTDPQAVGLAFDLESTARRRIPLVEDGVIVGLAHDRRTAAHAGTTSTGHHVAGSEVMGPMASDLVIAGGGRSPGDLVAEVERGILVTSLNYCRILDPRTLVVTGLTRNGTFLIEDGAVTRPLENLRFTQSFVDALAPGAVRGVGNDLRHADSEFGPGLVRAPTLSLAGWNFTGGADG